MTGIQNYLTLTQMARRDAIASMIIERHTLRVIAMRKLTAAKANGQ